MPSESADRSPDLRASAVLKIREKVLADKRAFRGHLRKASIPEKVRMLEEMRDLTRALQKNREMNKAKVKLEQKQAPDQAPR